MERYFDVVQDRRGNAISGASVLVKTEAGATATIYSDDGVTTTSNPLTTNADGEYTFFAANGKYTLQISADGYATETITEIVVNDPADQVASNIAVTDTAGYYSATNVETVLAEVGAWGEAIVVACSDETTALTTGTAKATFRMPFAMTVTGVRASLSTAQSSGSTFTVDINDGGTTILSTKLTIDNGEKTSNTAAATAVLSDTALADDAEVTIDIDQVGDGTAKGLKVTILGRRA